MSTLNYFYKRNQIKLKAVKNSSKLKLAIQLLPIQFLLLLLRLIYYSVELYLNLRTRNYEYQSKNKEFAYDANLRMFKKVYRKIYYASNLNRNSLLLI